MLALATVSPAALKRVFQSARQEKIEVTEPWGRLEKVADGVWALISTPFDKRDFTTVCNGGIIAGKNRVLAVESFMQPKGATWLAEQAKRLTGKWPTDVVSTHFHADHSAGHKGYFVKEHKPSFWLTDTTQKAAEASFSEREMPNNEFQNVQSIDENKGATIDLGGKTVRLVPRSGHTQSDITVEVVDPKIVWCGDLFFNRMFPNYGDATPSRLNEYVNQILDSSDVTYIPGHGPVADQKALQSYKDFLAFVEDSASTAFKKGVELEVAAKEFALPQKLSNWFVWSPDNAQKAYKAWYRELTANQKSEKSN